MEFNSYDIAINIPKEEILNSISDSISKYEKDPCEFLYNTANLLIQYGHFNEALQALIKCHDLNWNVNHIEEMIYKIYYKPNEESLKITYEKNIECFKNYKLMFTKEFPEFKDLEYMFIPHLANEYYSVFNIETAKFLSEVPYSSVSNSDWNFESGSILIVKNVVNSFDLMILEDQTKYVNDQVWWKPPLYLYYDNFIKFVQFLQIFDFTQLLGKNRLVFLFGYMEVIDWFKDPQTILPRGLLNSSGNDDALKRILADLYTYREALVAESKNGIKEYYDNLTKVQLISNIESGKPRILFFTSRFTTALQFYIRDCALACESLNIPYKVLIEEDDTNSLQPETWLSVINEFKPDIILGIDHYRWEYNFIDPNIFYVTWEQDMLPHMMTKESATKIGNMDIIFNQQYDTLNRLIELGYPERQIFDGPVPANPAIYKEYDLSEDEKDIYSTELCYFSNTGDSKKGLSNVISCYIDSVFKDQIEIAFLNAWNECYNMFYSDLDLAFNRKIVEQILDKNFEKIGICFSNDGARTNAIDLFNREVVYRMIREIPLLWLSEKGYNLKLYGMEWSNHPKLKDYSMGVAQNGETLSKIIKASTIVLGINPVVTCHPRVAETILSGGFYLGYNIPDKHDNADIRKYFCEERDIVLAYNRNDLYNKVDYYLDNEEKRQSIIRNGRKCILNQLTYEIFIQNVLEKSKEWLKSIT